MKVTHVDPPRKFGVGKRGGQLSHVADLELEHDEVVTLRTASGTEVDITRKSWGYYGTPSLNGRLREHGLRACLAVGIPREEGDPERIYLLLVEAGREDDFQDYIDAENMRVLHWLDSDESVAEAARRLGGHT